MMLISGHLKGGDFWSWTWWNFASLKCHFWPKITEVSHIINYIYMKILLRPILQDNLLNYPSLETRISLPPPLILLLFHVLMELLRISRSALPDMGGWVAPERPDQPITGLGSERRKCWAVIGQELPETTGAKRRARTDWTLNTVEAWKMFVVPESLHWSEVNLGGLLKSASSCLQEYNSSDVI